MAIPTHFKLNEQDLEWQTTCGTGAGGQHVNRTQSVIQLKLNLVNSHTIWPQEVFIRLKIVGKSFLIKDEYLLITANVSRSQYINRREAMEKLNELIRLAFIRPKVRHQTKPTILSIKKRLQGKQINSKKKQNRQNNFYD